MCPCPRSRLIIWSRETDSAVPSRVSLLISILRLNLVLTYGIPPEFRGGVHLFIITAILRHWDSPEFIGVRRHGTSKPQGSSICLLIFKQKSERI